MIEVRGLNLSLGNFRIEDLNLATARLAELTAASGPVLGELQATLDAWDADPRAHRKAAKHLAVLASVADRAGRIRHDLAVARIRCERAFGRLIGTA